MTLLSARDTPIARRFEIWVPDATGDALVFHSGDCDQNTALAGDYRSAKVGKGDGTIGQVWQSGIPAVLGNMRDDASAAGRSAAAAGLGAVMALPVSDARGLKAIVAWYF